MEAMVVALSLAFMVAPMIWLVLLLLVHDHEHPELNSWYQGLHSGIGPCCDGAEAVHLADPDWATQDKCIVNDATHCYSWSHYRVYLDKQWIDVPDSAVVTGPNRDGRTLVWPFRSPMATKANIRCFMPGTEV